MSRFSAVLAGLTPCLALPGSPEFHAWTAEHGKSYGSEQEEQQAYETFMANERIIEALNAEPSDGAVYGHTRFSDLTPAQFRQQYLGVPEASASDSYEQCQGGGTVPVPEGPPASFDWRSQGAVGPVRDQGSCGSCWAESAVANIEGQMFLATGKPVVSLSTEQVIECDAHDYGCYGGWPSGAYQHVLEAGGLASKQDYDYRFEGKTVCLANQTFNETCGDGMCDDPPLTNWCDVTCEQAKHEKVAKISGWASLPEDEDQLAAVLSKQGPISVAIDASGGGLSSILAPWLQFYKSGVARPKKCTQTLDHAVLLVGYGEDNGDKYWLIKNSWGEKFGEDGGFFRLHRGDGTCGVNTCATTALVASELTV
jgi:cathepsin F